MLEHIIDELLNQLELSRANVIYAIGGHAYLILANTGLTKEIIAKFEKDTNNWFIESLILHFILQGIYM